MFPVEIQQKLLLLTFIINDWLHNQNDIMAHRATDYIKYRKQSQLIKYLFKIINKR